MVQSPFPKEVNHMKEKMTQEQRLDYLVEEFKAV